MAPLQDDRTPLALAALAEVTDADGVGDLLEVEQPEEGVRNLIFACRLPGYAAWRWTVSTAQVDDAEPTVLEVELLPGEGALLAPPWVPWAERLAEYRRTHPDDELDEDEDEDDEGDDEDEDDEDLDDADLDPVDDALEIDGVDFEEADEAALPGDEADDADEQGGTDADEPDEADGEHDGSDPAEADERP